MSISQIRNLTKQKLILKSIPKNLKFFCILNYLIPNFQEICKIPKPKTQLLKQIENPNPDLNL